jgi:hypothetical protein
MHIHVGISLHELNALELSVLGLLDWRCFFFPPSEKYSI